MDMNIDISVCPLSGKEFVVSGISFNDTVYQVKKKIHELKGFSVDQQMLLLPHEEERLDDKLKVSSIHSLMSAPKRTLKLRVFYKMISLLIKRQGQTESDLIVKTYPCCSVLELKITIQKHTAIAYGDQTLSYNGVIMNNDKALIDYNLKDSEDLLFEGSSATTTLSRPFEILLFVRKGNKGKLNLGIDFSFNIIKNVRKVEMKKTAPWYRELSDGLSWLCYCRNAKCEIADELFIVHKGFGHFYLDKERKTIKCPLCQKGVFEIRNIGFVCCQWQYKGVLANKKDSRITGEGRTYDSKLYTFKEANYNIVWETLELLAKPLDRNNNFQNISKDESVNSIDLFQQPIEKEEPFQGEACRCTGGKGGCCIF
eukprot:TRINITY_DN13118_c0_g1_i11.p1 TRINITY_DN13118_c0_g1~~TRINITY_DN13118_c0_g1_i11.p1  ORF type:complete len:370 (+),score=88.07 TRINITY_DN13118_c0_g1_i11:121-1230(+)